jgi:hypothetical protein
MSLSGGVVALVERGQSLRALSPPVLLSPPQYRHLDQMSALWLQSMVPLHIMVHKGAFRARQNRGRKSRSGWYREGSGDYRQELPHPNIQTKTRLLECPTCRPLSRFYDP